MLAAVFLKKLLIWSKWNWFPDSAKWTLPKIVMSVYERYKALPMDREHFDIQKTLDMSVKRAMRTINKEKIRVSIKKVGQLLWSGGKMILFLSIKCGLIILYCPTVNSFLLGQSFFVLTFVYYSNDKGNRGYFVYPSCCPSKKQTIFKSTHTTHLWLSFQCSFHTFICFLNLNWMGKWDWTIFVSIVQKDALQTSLRTINK